MEGKVEKLDYLIHTIFYANKMKEDSSQLRELTNNELATIALVKNGMVVKDLQKCLQVPKSTLSNIIRRLEDKGYIKREINPIDKRSYIIQLTEKGKKVNQKHENDERRLFEEILNQLDSDDEIDELLRLLEKILKKQRGEDGQ